MTKLLALLALAICSMATTSYCCNDGDYGSTEVDVNSSYDCNNTVTEDEKKTRTKFAPGTGGPVKIEWSDDLVATIDSTEIPSRTNKWRTEPCKKGLYNRKIAILLWSDIQEGDYIQINKRKFRGTTKCNGYSITHEFISSARSLLIGLNNTSGKSSFRLKAFCPSSAGSGMMRSILHCPQVINYIGDSDEKFLWLPKLLQDDAGSIQSYLNRNVEDNIHKCNILMRSTQYCHGYYLGGECENNF